MKNVQMTFILNGLFFCRSRDTARVHQDHGKFESRSRFQFKYSIKQGSEMQVDLENKMS